MAVFLLWIAHWDATRAENTAPTFAADRARTIRIFIKRRSGGMYSLRKQLYILRGLAASSTFGLDDCAFVVGIVEQRVPQLFLEDGKRHRILLVTHPRMVASFPGIDHGHRE